MQTPSIKTVAMMSVGVLCLFLYTVFAVVVLHHRMHPYWRTQPVAWTTLRRAEEGFVMGSWQRPPRNARGAKAVEAAGLRLHAVPAPTAAQAQHIAAFLNEHGANTSVMKPEGVRAAGGWLLLQSKRGRNIVGAVSHASVAIDTPIHDAVDVQWVDNLCMRPDMRGRALCTVLIDGVIRADHDRHAHRAVSYTHLTLPTICSV